MAEDYKEVFEADLKSKLDVSSNKFSRLTYMGSSNVVYGDDTVLTSAAPIRKKEFVHTIGLAMTDMTTMLAGALLKQQIDSVGRYIAGELDACISKEILWRRTSSTERLSRAVMVDRVNFETKLDQNVTNITINMSVYWTIIN